MLGFCSWWLSECVFCNNAWMVVYWSFFSWARILHCLTLSSWWSSQSPSFATMLECCCGNHCHAVYLSSRCNNYNWEKMMQKTATKILLWSNWKNSNPQQLRYKYPIDEWGTIEVWVPKATDNNQCLEELLLWSSHRCPKQKFSHRYDAKQNQGWKNTLVGEENTNKRQCQELALQFNQDIESTFRFQMLRRELRTWIQYCKSFINTTTHLLTRKMNSRGKPFSDEWVSEQVKLHLKVVTALSGVVSDHASSPKLEKWVWKIRVLEIVTVNQSCTWEERSLDVWQSVTFRKNITGPLQHKKKMTNRINCM